MDANRKINAAILFIVTAAIIGSAACAPRSGPSDSIGLNYGFIGPGDRPSDIIRKAANVVPSPRQWTWQEREFIAFAHFGMNTFTDREWGQGNENPALFNPSDFDARQWARAFKEAGMRMLIVTAKHHDGFCLWPSRFTNHSVKSSPWRGGRGDVVGEVAAACRETGLAFGVYLSPWDRHEPSFGDSPRYNEFFRNQLRELLTNYGPVAEVWFDGANNEGPNGKRQEYDWPSYYGVIRELQPDAVIAIMGPDIRWVGTESGYGRETEWSVVPADLSNLDEISARSQKFPLDSAFLPKDQMNEDLGSRDKILKAKALIWYPAETDVSIRPGWFYHQKEDARVRPAEKLLDIYYSSVGRNGLLLLNVPPDKRGLVHENDIRSLMELRGILDKTFKTNLALEAQISASSAKKGFGPGRILDNDKDTYWTTEDGVESAWIEFAFSKETTFDRAMLRENIRVGQRIERFSLAAWDGSEWKVFTLGTTVGAKRLLRFPPVKTAKVRLMIEQSRTNPALSAFGLYRAPEINR